MLVDQNDRLVGSLVDPYSPVVIRKVGLDWVALPVGPNGFLEGALFYHQSSDCSDGRLAPTFSIQGLVYPAQSQGGLIFYTNTRDPLGVIALPIGSHEIVMADNTTA